MTSSAPRSKRIVLAALLAAVLVACHQTTAGTAQQASPVRSSAPQANPSLLDPGKYPISPLPPLGEAGTDQAGRLVEGRRMAAYVAGPWQADPALSGPGSTGTATVVTTFDQLSKVVWIPIMGGAFNLPFVAGFSSERQTAGPNPQLLLRNAVLRFANAASAAAAAQGMHARAMSMPRIPSATPIVTEPEQAIPIPGHPDGAAALLTFQDGPRRCANCRCSPRTGPTFSFRSRAVSQGRSARHRWPPARSTVKYR